MKPTKTIHIHRYPSQSIVKKARVRIKLTMEEEALPPVTEEVIRKVRKSVNLDEERTKEAVEVIKEWIQQQPHLPKTDNDGRLERWLIRCKNSMEKTKQTLDSYYTLRTFVPELMCGWDVSEEWFLDACKDTYYIPMPTLTDEFDRVSVFGMSSQYHPDFNLLHAFKVGLQVFEIQMCEDYNSKNIFVIDLKNSHISDIPKIDFALIKKMIVCLLKGFKTRIRAIHYINTPSYAEFFVTFMKSILKDKLVARFHVHGTDLTKFYKQVPKHLLPAEYGGNAGTVQENWNRWQRKLNSYRIWFLQQETMKSEESRRPSNKTTSNELFGFEGSFRKLTID